MDKRIEKSNQSLLALSSLLREVINHPETYIHDQQLNTAFNSQGALAKFSNTSKGIFSLSINTQKRIADSIINGGYEGLNKSRINALLALESSLHTNKKPNKETKAGLLLVNQQLEKEMQSIRHDLLLLTLAFEKSLRQGAVYASRSDSPTQALCKKEQRELLDMLTLRNIPHLKM